MSDHDELSKQRRWQIAQVAKGNCEICGKPRNNYADMCDLHAVKHRVRVRKKSGHQPWSPGGSGRVPRVLEAKEIRLTSVITVRGRDRGELVADPSFVYVGRRCGGWPTSMWGNPWRVGGKHPLGGEPLTAAAALLLFQTETLRAGSPGGSYLLSRIGELRGKMLGCWCGDWKPSEPEIQCHAVVLAKLADALES